MNPEFEDIKQRLDQNIYFSSEIKNTDIHRDLSHLIKLIEEQNKQIAHLEKKNQVLQTQVLELTQDIENVKSDFGDMR